MPDYMNLFNAMSQTGEMFQNRRDRENKPPFEWEISSGKDGGPPEASLKTDAETAMNIRKALENYGQIMASMQQEVGRLQAQEERQRQGLGPLMSVLSTVSGELAQDRRLPPVVSALGRANLALNPPPQALQAQKMGVLQAMGDLSSRGLMAAESAQRMGMEQQRIGIEGARLEEQKAENLRRDSRERISKFNQETRLIAQKGGGPLSYDAFTALAQTRGLTPDEIRTAYIAHQEEAQIVTQGKEAEKGRQIQVAEKKGEIALKNRIAGINQGFMLRTSKNALDFQTQLYQNKKAIDTAVASDKELKVVGNKDLTALKQASATDAYIDKVEYMFNQPEWANVAGPVFSYDPATNSAKFNPQAAIPKAFKNIPRTQVESMISHEIPRLLTLLLNGQAGGASILRIEAGQKLIKDMGVTGAIRPDQALAIMKIVRDTNNENKASTMRAHPEVDWSRRRDLLGVDTPGNRQYFYEHKTFMGSPVQPFPDPTVPKGGTPGTKQDDPLGIR